MSDADIRMSGIRFPADLHKRLKQAAEERHLSVNFLVVTACEELLDNLIPVEELRYTRRPGDKPNKTEEADR